MVVKKLLNPRSEDNENKKGPPTRWEEREEGKGGYLAEGPKLYKMK